jgi:integral membrane sensor signal transduction histidine kinase
MHRYFSFQVLAVLVLLVLLCGVSTESGPSSLIQLVIMLSMGLLVCWIWWAAKRSGRRQAEQLRSQQIAAAVTTERLTIARDLHDLVSHGIGLITVRASVARNVDAEDPERLVAALYDIEQASRATTLELRRMLQVLRSDQDAPLSPSPGDPNWDGLLESAERAGLHVKMSNDGVTPNSEGVALAIHRILQEGLANAARHAGPTSVHVELARRGEVLHLAVTDSGPVPGWRSRPGAGSGLIGLRERVAALGGNLRHHRSPDGFRLEAELPDPEPVRA